MLRVVLRQPGQLAEWKKITTGVVSGLAEVECLRTLDRLRVGRSLSADDIVLRREALYRVLAALEVLDVSPSVLRRAAQPLPTPLGTLDAIHLASAEVWREARKKELTVATHDRALALAAQASGFQVIGTVQH